MEEIKIEELTSEQIQELSSKIDMVRAFSSSIVAIGYDKEKQILKVLFKGNSCYLYFNVEPDIWNNLSKAESKGKYLREAVVKNKEKYKYIKI